LLPYTTTLLYTHYIYIDIDIDINMCTRLVPVHCSGIGEGERKDRIGSKIGIGYSRSIL